MRKPRYTNGYIDRHGKPRFYFRRRGSTLTALPGLPWSPEFMAAYEAALKGDALPPAAVEIAASKTVPGTISALVVAFYNSGQFKGLKPSTQATYRNIIERFRADHGHRPVATIQRDKLIELLGNRATTPAAANNWLRMVRMLMQFATFAGFRTDDPTVGIKRIKSRSEGFRPWSDQDIDAFRQRHELGTRPRLALELLAGTGQRRGDVVRMGRQHIRDGVLSIRQEKTGTLVEIPILPELQEAIAAMPRADHLTFLVTEFNKSFVSAGFGNWFREQCNAAGLPKGLAAHGLRKAAATRHANAGATAHELMAWFGWTTLKEPARYTQAANRKTLAHGMVAKLKKRTSSEPK